MVDFKANPLVNARMEDLEWLEGHWSGQAGGDEVDEVWAGAAAGAVVGMFRSTAAGKVRFYEFMTITKDSDRIGLTIKHFDPDLVGWEEKDGAARLVLTESTDRRAVFYQASGDKHLWLIYEGSDEAGLRIYFRPVENSPVGDSVFTLHRKT